MASLRLKVRQGSKGLTVFVSRVVRSGKIQKLFAEKIGHATGSCVRGKVHKGMSGGEIHQAVIECAPKKGTVKLR